MPEDLALTWRQACLGESRTAATGSVFRMRIERCSPGMKFSVALYSTAMRRDLAVISYRCHRSQVPSLAGAIARAAAQECGPRRGTWPRNSTGVKSSMRLSTICSREHSNRAPAATLQSTYTRSSRDDRDRILRVLKHDYSMLADGRRLIGRRLYTGTNARSERPGPSQAACRSERPPERHRQPAFRVTLSHRLIAISAVEFANRPGRRRRWHTADKGRLRVPLGGAGL